MVYKTEPRKRLPKCLNKFWDALENSSTAIKCNREMVLYLNGATKHWGINSLFLALFFIMKSP